MCFEGSVQSLSRRVSPFGEDRDVHTVYIHKGPGNRQIVTQNSVKIIIVISVKPVDFVLFVKKISKKLQTPTVCLFIKPL